MEHSSSPLVAGLAPPDIAAMCRAIRASDDATFTSFYERHFDTLLAMTRAFTHRDESYCLDIVHDTMLRVIRSIPDLSSEGELLLWLRRAMVSCVIDRVRADTRRARREARVAAPEPFEKSNSELDWLRDRLHALSTDDQALLALRFAHGSTLETIASIEGVTLGSTHGRIRRALAKLRALLKAGEP